MKAKNQIYIVYFIYIERYINIYMLLCSPSHCCESLENSMTMQKTKALAIIILSLSIYTYEYIDTDVCVLLTLNMSILSRDKTYYYNILDICHRFQKGYRYPVVWLIESDNDKSTEQDIPCRSHNVRSN